MKVEGSLQTRRDEENFLQKKVGKRSGERNIERTVNTPDEIDEAAILQEKVASRQAKVNSEQAVVLRAYNYFRIILSFILLFLSYEFADQTLVGTLEPRWFQRLVLAYLTINVAYGFAVVVSRDARIAVTATITSVVVLDIIFLSLLLFASGGISSSLGYLLVFAVSFGSMMVPGKKSFLFPVAATIASISVEVYLHTIVAVEGVQHFFHVTILITAFFMVNFFFQHVSRRITEREVEVAGLQTLDQIHQIAEQTRQELELSDSRFSVLLTSTAEGVLGLDIEGIVTFANPRACQLLDIEYDDLIDSDIQRFMTREADSRDDKVISFKPEKILALLGIDAKHVYNSSKWQTVRRDSFIVEYSCEATVNKSGERTGAVLLLQNITQQRENEERIQYLTNYDDLTGLANRANFQEVLKSAISGTRRTDRSMAILIVDIDHLSVINENMGQDTGDELLKIVAQRLLDSVREGDMVARLHADHFAVMLVDLDRAENAVIAADNIIKAIAEPMLINGNDVSTSVSIGIAELSESHNIPDDLINAGMSAVDNAKDEGRNTYRFFHADMQKRAEEKKRVQMLLRTAADNDEFEMVYQPILSLKNGKIQSCEALIRWFPKDGAPIRPDIFIPIAEESGQISKIGSWVLAKVSQQVKNWKSELGRYPTIAINVSTKQLRDSEFRKQFLAMTRTYEIPVEAVELELTETGMMEDPERCLEELTKLHDIGVSISIDDFGTGYSSLDYLRRLPLDILKIDMSFTSGIGVSENDEEIVLVMIRMAHAMGLKVICEGVETKEQLEFLKRHDCDQVQGYYFSKPKSVKEITELFIRESNGTIDIMAGEAS